MRSKSDQDLNSRTAITGNQTPMPPAKRSTIFPSPPLPSPSSSTSLIRRRSSSSVSDSAGCSAPFAELAGGATAECAAVCCCCPCGLAHLLYLTIYKVPAGLFRRALRKKRNKKKLMQKGLLLEPRTKRCYCDLDDIEMISSELRSEGEISSSEDDGEEDEAMVKLEEEMWKTFYNAGFWRSPSQREPPAKILIIESPKANKVVKQL